MDAETNRLKTIFLFLRQGISNRNLLRTDFLKTLKNEPGIRVEVFSPIGSDPEFRKELEAENVCAEEWPRTKVGFWEKRLKNLKHCVWLARPDSVTSRIKYRAARGWWRYRWAHLLGKVFFSLGVNESRINGFELKLFKPHPSIASLYDQYRPDLVLFTRVFGTNVHVIKEAKRRGIRVVCLVESWDNLTSKGPMSVIPDRLVAWNAINKGEACSLHQFREEDVLIGGVPQFDLYEDTALFGSREDFLRRLNIDPKVKLVTYATCTEGNATEEIETIEYIYEAVRRGRVKGPCHLLLRLHPISSPTLVKQYFSRFEGKPGITVQRPGRPSRLHDGWDPTWSDMVELAQTLHHSDVLTNIASTITLDAAYLDTPIVCVAFDGNSRKKGYFESCRRIYDYSCWQNVLKTGGVRVASDLEETIQWVNAYLDNPDLDSEGRERIKQEQAHFFDGKSAERMARIVLSELGIPPAKAPGQAWASAQPIGSHRAAMERGSDGS